MSAAARARRLAWLLAVTVTAPTACRPREAAQSSPTPPPPVVTTPSTTTTTTLPPPPPVWRAAQWRMTAADVLAGFAGEAQAASPPVPFAAAGTGAAEVVIPSYETDGSRFRVLFGFANGLLNRIQLAAARAEAGTCEDLEKRLTGDHGEPSSRRDTVTSMQTREIAWTLPRQTITLTCAEKPSLGFRTITLDYAPTEGAAAN